MRKRNKVVGFDTIIQDKKIPILTLDTRWHELFPEDKKTNRIRELEQKVNQLLKTQGKLVNDIKDMKKLKKTLLKDIIVNMDADNDTQGKAKGNRLKKNKRYINELNDKIKDASDQLLDLPNKIKEANEELLIESLKICYEAIHSYDEELVKISEWINKTRDELKKKILLKHDIETNMNLIYSNMHDILGAEIIDLFDRTQNNNKIDNNSP